jgi:hypothetical protein
MPANIGHPKASGREKGTPNKITAAIRERITAIIEDNYMQVAKDIASLPPEKRVETWIKLLDFVTPRMQRSENRSEHSFRNGGLRIGYGDRGVEGVKIVFADDEGNESDLP